MLSKKLKMEKSVGKMVVKEVENQWKKIYLKTMTDPEHEMGCHGIRRWVIKW